jgi:hypothetical protein
LNPNFACLAEQRQRRHPAYYALTQPMSKPYAALTQAPSKAKHVSLFYYPIGEVVGMRRMPPRAAN